MARKVIDIGIVGNDGTGDSIRDSFRKVNDNFRELYSSLGLGENLTFIGLDDTPQDYFEKANHILVVNDTTDGVAFKELIEGSGISIEYPVDPLTGTNTKIRINSEFSDVSGDPTPQLGGDLSARAGTEQYRILDLPPYTFGDILPGGPQYPDEAVSKAYADSKIARAGVDAIDPATDAVNPELGIMTGPLILSRSPVPEDDEIYDGLIAATKAYVDNSAFGSTVNLYVATSGQDERVGLSPALQGRALAYAYRTLEAALKRAEEIINDSRKEIGPYKKVLTYNNGASKVVLEKIDEAPTSGFGFSGIALMSVDTVELVATLSDPRGGVNYNIGDILTVVGGTFSEPARFQVLSTATTPGSIVTLRTLSTGVYQALPGSISGQTRLVSTTATSSTGGSTFGSRCNLSLTFKVNRIQKISGGLGYGLVSVRVVGGGGSGAFGTADIVAGVIQSITVTDGGTGFYDLPNVRVDLPRFLLRTEGYRTDFTGDVVTDTEVAKRGRDIREGLYIRGETSGALAQILSHTGELDSEGREIFDVDILYGQFRDEETYGVGEGEWISYGDATIQTQITVLVESGIYEENLPLRVPQNVAIVGDEFRRVLVRPKDGVSSSPWAFLYFRRDVEIDGLITADEPFGYHYLDNPRQPVYPLVANRGFNRASAKLLELNRSFLQQQIIGWLDDQVENNISPFGSSFTYDRSKIQQELGQTIDSIIFDLKYGGSDRTISTALKLKESLDLSVSRFEALWKRLKTLSQLVIKNITITELYLPIINPQIVDGAYAAESGVTGTTVLISNISRSDPCIITTSTPHGLSNGDEIIISGIVGTTELNGNNFYVSIQDATNFGISEFSDLSVLVDSTNFTTYVSGGSVTKENGILSALIDAIINVISNSGSVNYPKENNQMDVFLCNDAVILRAMTVQGHGGFTMVLDPWGQILAKSPYAQECASFSKSIGRHTFSGGMFVDGFAGNIKFQLLGKQEIDAVTMTPGRSYTIKTLGTTNYTLLGASSNTVGIVFRYNGVAITGTGTVEDNGWLRVGTLARIPQLPASFIVSDTVYRINYIRDYTYITDPLSPTAISTASFILDENTPWPFDLITYNPTICRRDVGLIIDGLGYDIVLETNYNARRAGLSYRQANASVVVLDQLDITARAIEQAHDYAYFELTGFTLAQGTVNTSKAQMVNIIRNGTSFSPTLLMTNPSGVSSDIANAKNLLTANVNYVKEEMIGWIDAQISGSIAPFAGSFTYNISNWSNRIQYIVEATIYDLLYGGNSKTRYEAASLYDDVGDTVSWQLEVGAEAEFAAAVNYLSSLLGYVITNSDPPVSYSSAIRTTGTPATGTEVTLIQNLLTDVESVASSGLGSLPAEVLPDLNAYAYLTSRKNARTELISVKTSIQDDTITWIDENINVYEVLMPGNRSMLSNDFTQLNDMGYGLIATNGGLTEAVSMFTYYCYISYYALNGAQIRSIGGSSSHGVYALVAEGSDPLEVPTPCNVYYEFAQGITCYFPNPLYANIPAGLEIYVTNYSYVPLPNSELEIDHGYDLFRYTVTSVSTQGLPPGVAVLNLRSDDGTGLFVAVPDGQKMTIRNNSQVILTGDLVEVAVRPSTGLILNESDEVYRVLQFEEYTDPNGAYSCTISNSNPTLVTRNNHGLEPGYELSFVTTGTLPTGLLLTETYFVLPDNFSNNSFQISLERNGIPVGVTSTGAGSHSYILEGLTRTTLRENYNYVDLTVWPTPKFATSSINCTISIATPTVITTVSPHGFSNGDVIKFESTGTLPTPLNLGRSYFVANIISPTQFTMNLEIGDSAEAETLSPGTGTHSVGLVIGRVGDDEISVVPIGPEEDRVLGTKFVFLGEEYTITRYDNEAITNEPFAIIAVTPPLKDSVIQYNTLPTLKSAVAKGEVGTLTIRISLTRVTSHDLLEIGTGSYADTNYPSEIFGPPVNPINDANEVEERDVGRVFYVTTDQFGNFSVGPYFRVDQGTGTVTFSAAIALSNLDGIGFKRGVPVSEFSTDSGFSDNATDTVPTENATRIYLERRLGLTHNGAIVPDIQLIPSFTGGYMALDGQLSMKADMDLDDNAIINVGDPTNPQDAVNLRSLTWANFQNAALNNVRAGDIITFTGAGADVQNSAVVGDISFDIDSTANTVDAQINPGVILDVDINATAGIQQSKLSLTLAGTLAAAPTGSAAAKQAASGVASFDNAQFTATDGWITVKNNGLTLNKLAQIADKTVLGNSSGLLGNVTATTFATVVNQGLAIKKSNYTSVGFLRRKNATSPDGDTGSSVTDSYEVIDAEAGYTYVSGHNNTLVRRSSSGDFGGNNINATRYQIDGKNLADSTTSGSGGVLQLYGWNGQTALLLGDGSDPNDKRNYYDNEGHIFRPQNGIGYAPITCSTINANAIVGTGSPSTTMTGTFVLGSGSTLQATYADLAEYYEADTEYEVGTVLIFGGEKEVTLGNKEGDHRVAGVVSQNAALVMNESCKGIKILIALQGRVPCRVVGKIQKGDLMITSRIPGVAISASGDAKAGTIIGKALENYESDHIGTIEVAVGRT